MYKNDKLESHRHPDSPPPHVHVSLQGEQQVSEQPLVHRRPLELRDTKHGRARARAELPTLLLRHGHAPETQIDTQVSLQLGCSATVEGLQHGREWVGSASTVHLVLVTYETWHICSSEI